MSKQILILNGSPRIHGNTAALIDAFTAGAQSADLVIAVTNLDETNLLCCFIAKKLGAGHTIARFDLAALDIHGCRGCLGGGKDPRHPCVQRNGMDAVYPALHGRGCGGAGLAHVLLEHLRTTEMRL